MAKARRKALELQEAIMLEVRRHPKWTDILGVTITERHPVAPPHLDCRFHDVRSAHCPGARAQIDQSPAKRIRLRMIREGALSSTPALLMAADKKRPGVG